MANQIIGLGTVENDGTGDNLRVALDKVNDNFLEIYTLIGDASSLTSGISATATVVTLTAPTISGVVGGTITSATITTLTGTTFNAGTLALSAGSITDSSGAISFGNENLTTTGVVTAASVEISGNLNVGGNLDVTGTVSFSDNNITDVGTLGVDSLFGDGDTDTSITFSGSNVITFKANNANQITITDGAVSPVTDSDVDLGTTSLRYKDVYVDSITVTGEVDGASLDISGSADIDADLLVGDDLTLNSDAAILGFGADTDVTLTHVADTGLLLNSTMALQFNDASQYINAPSATILDINATDEIELNATLLDVNANVEISGTAAIVGVATFTATPVFSADVTIEDDLFLDSDAAVLHLGEDGDVTLTHVADTGVLLNSTRQLQFGDSGTYIHQSADGVLDLVSDTELELNATTIDINGNVEISGTADIVGVATFTATPVFSADVTIEDDLFLDSDAAVIHLGEDGDVTLTHVADTGLLLNSTMQLQFNDASQFINAPSATVLGINATDEIELNATLLDVNANINASGTYTGAGLMTTGGNIVIPNAGNIGSVSDTDAISISSGGVVTFNQIPIFSAGVNVSGGTLAGTLSTAAQGNITSLGTLTALQVDNININGNAITSTAGTDLTITPVAGQQIVLDGTIVVDAGVVTGATSITSTAFVGDITGDVTGNADTATVLATARTIGGVSFDGSANINLPGVNSAGNQNTTGSAATLTTARTIGGTSFNGSANIDVALATLATTVTVSDSTANTNFPVVFTNESNALLDDTGALRYNPSTGTLLVPNLVVAGTTTQVDTVTMEAANAIVFEGATADAYETTLTITDPTAEGATTTAAITASGIIKTDDTTAATSTTDGSLQTDGGLSVAADAVIGDDLFMLSDAAVITFGADKDVTLTHVADTGLLLNGNLSMANAAGPSLLNEVATSTNPTIIPNKADPDTGIGWVSADIGALVAGGAEVARWDTTNGITVAALKDVTLSGRVSVSNITNINTQGFRLADGTSSILTMLSQHPTGAFRIQQYDGVSEWSSRLAIDTDGNVGIGTTAPSQKLEVAGNIAIANAGNIGSAGDADAIAIASNGVVTFSQIPVMPANSIDSDEYIDGSIDREHLAADIIDGTKIADDAIDSEHYTDGSIDLAHMSANSVDSDQYVDGSIDTVHIADNQITLAKMAGIARGKIIYGDASGDPAVLTAGSNGQVLTSDGTDISWAAAGLATVTDSIANTNFPVVFHNESNALLDDTGALRYNPSTGTLLVPNLVVAGTTTQVDTVTMEAANAIVFEGATADASMKQH
jgi:uncharacterized protein YqkB